MKESEIENKLRDGIRALGGRAYKFVSPGNDGVPDRIVVIPDLSPIFVELKTEKGRLTALQKRQIDRLRALGQDVRVLYGMAEVKNFLQEMKEKMK